jgi:hypothetical protein
MNDRAIIESLITRLAWRARWVRAVSRAAATVPWGLAAAALILAARDVLPPWAPWAALFAALGPSVLAFIAGLALSLPRRAAALLADGRLGLRERLTTALDLAGEESEMAQAQRRDAAQAAKEVRPATALPLGLPPRARWALPLGALAAALLLLPPIPIPRPGAARSNEAEARKDEKAEEEKRPMLAKDQPPLPREAAPLTKSPEKREPRRALGAREAQGDLSAAFRDTQIATRRPDFSSFLKGGDERLKLLGQTEALPDLSGDFTQSPYQVMIRRLQQQLRNPQLRGLSWEDIQRLLQELGEAGRRFGDPNLADELGEDMGGSEGTPADRAMSALARALGRLRDRQERAQGGKNLRPAQPGSGLPQDGGEDGLGDESPGEGSEEGARQGTAPGKGRSPQTRGAMTPRLPGQRMDSMLSGEARRGKKEAYDTNLSGPGARNPSQLPFLDLFSQYRKQMEEALNKEPIPFDYREQVKEYFQSLERGWGQAGPPPADDEGMGFP